MAGALVCVASLGGAVYLIANGFEYGWGWLLALAFVATAAL